MTTDQIIALSSAICGGFFGLGGLGVAIWNAARVGKIERYKSNLAKETESFKSEIATKHETALEKYRTDLRIEAHEQQLVISNWVEKQTGAIEKLHLSLVRSENALKRLTSIFEASEGPSKQERAKAFLDEYGHFVKLLDENKLYLSEELCELFNKFYQAFHETYSSFYVFVLRKGTDPNSDSYLKNWKEAFDATTKDIPKLRLALEVELRRILKSENKKRI